MLDLDAVPTTAPRPMNRLILIAADKLATIGTIGTNRRARERSPTGGLGERRPGAAVHDAEALIGDRASV